MIEPYHSQLSIRQQGARLSIARLVVKPSIFLHEKPRTARNQPGRQRQQSGSDHAEPYPTNGDELRSPFLLMWSNVQCILWGNIITKLNLKINDYS